VDRETARAAVDWLRRVIQEELRAEWASLQETKRQERSYIQATKGQPYRSYTVTEPSIKADKIAGRVIHRTTERECPTGFRQLPANAAAHRIFRQLNWLCQFGLIEEVPSQFGVSGWKGYKPLNILDALARAAVDPPSGSN
jgi:hypothetical protein